MKQSGSASVSAPAGRFKMPPIVGIFLTVFLDLLAFGIFIPDLQLRGRELAVNALGSSTDSRIGILVGVSLACFSLAQLLTSPLLGRLSDQKGRRLVLLITCFISGISYLVYGHAESLAVMMLARVLSGVAAANLGVAFAYIADITTPQDRAKSLGLIGAAFGLGFIIGPALGGVLLEVNHNSPLVLSYVGSGLSFLNLAYVWFLLPESLKEPRRGTSNFRQDLRIAFKTPGLGLLLVMFFALNLGFTNLESTFFQLLADPMWIYKLGDKARSQGAYLLAFVGVIGVIMQGFVVRRVTPIFGEVKLLRFAYLLYVPVFAAVPFTPLWIPMLIGILLMGIASGLANPCISSLISRSAPRTMQGGIFGITQALGALARFVGPLVSNPLFEVKPYLPYALGAGIIMIPAIAIWRIKMPDLEDGSEVVPVH